MYLHSFFVGLAVVAGAVGAEAAEKPRTDLYGDPLPDGAVLRLGTTRLRSNAKLIQFTPDGRMLITTEQGRIVKHWNAEDGEAREVFTLPLPSWSPERFRPMERSTSAATGRASAPGKLPPAVCCISSQAFSATKSPSRRTERPWPYRIPLSS